MNFLDYKKFENEPDELFRNKIWDTVDFRPIDVGLGNHKYLQLLKEEIGYFGFASFQIPTENEALNWSISRGRLKEINFFKKFWYLPGPLSVFEPLLELNSVGDGWITRTGYEAFAPLCLDGYLASLMWDAYAPWPKTPFAASEVLEFAQSFRKSMLDDRFEEVFAFRSDPSSRASADYSQAIFDKRKCLVHIMFMAFPD